VPRNAFDGLKDPAVVHHFSLEVQGIEECTFREASGFGSTNEVIEHREVAKGRQYIVKQPGNLKWEDIVLKRGMTDSRELYNWRKLVEEGKIHEARKSGSVIMYDATNSEIGRINFVRGWPSQWKGPDVNTTNNAVSIESLTITHEGMAFV